MMRSQSGKMLVRSSDHRMICQGLILADTFWRRLRGLLGASPLAPDHGLLIAPARDIHTWGMRYAIDLVFLDDALRIVHLHAHVPPWRCCVVPRSAGRKSITQVLELRAGRGHACGLEIGDQLRVCERSGGDGHE